MLGEFNGLVLASFLSQAKDSEGQEQAQPKLRRRCWGCNRREFQAWGSTKCCVVGWGDRGICKLGGKPSSIAKSGGSEQIYGAKFLEESYDRAGEEAYLDMQVMVRDFNRFLRFFVPSFLRNMIFYFDS